MEILNSLQEVTLKQITLVWRTVGYNILFMNSNIQLFPVWGWIINLLCKIVLVLNTSHSKQPRILQRWRNITNNLNCNKMESGKQSHWKVVRVVRGNLKMTFRNTAPCSLLDVDRRVRGAYCRHHRSTNLPDDGGSTNPWKSCQHIRHYKAACPRRLSFS
jgi:hypothetical protein